MINQIFNGVIGFLEYYAICDNVSVIWKRTLRSECPLGAEPENKLAKLIGRDHTASMVYDSLIHYSYVPYEKIEKWSHVLNRDIPLQEMLCYYKHIYQITNWSKLRSFQYRLLHHALVFNRFLFLCKIREDNKCSFCKEIKEDPKGVLKKVYAICREYFNYGNLDHFPTRNQIIFNDIVKPPCNVINHIFLQAKQYLFKMRCAQEKLQFVQFGKEIYLTINIEKYIAIKNGTLIKHNKK